MRVAVFSDVHGNLAALDAVLADARRADVDEFWVAGDLVAHGPHPAATIRRLMELPNARFVRGNTDRYVLTGELSPVMPLSDVGMLVRASCSFAWTRGAITAVGGYDWLASLPVERTATLPDVPLDRTVAGVRVVNLGSVSLPFTAEERAMWTLLDANKDGFTVQRRYADYDIDAVARALDSEHHPSAEWLKSKLRRSPVG